MSGMGSLLWLLVAGPLGVGALLAAAGRRSDRVAPGVAVVISLLVLADAAAVAVGRPRVQAPLLAGIPAGLAVDGLSAVLVVTVAAVTVAVVIYAAGEREPGEARGRFFGLLLVFAGAMLVTVTATGLAPLLMGFEVMGACSWALIGFWWREPRRVRAAHTAFLTTRTADLGLYVATGAALAGGVPALALDRLAGAEAPWLSLLTFGVVLAALGKSAQLPFSFWLSRAMQGPSPVSALLHSATMVAAGAYLLLRLQPLLAASGWGQPLVAWIGAATALLLGAVAAGQRDLKQLLAASTSSQIGFMVLAAGVGGVAGGVLQLVAHAATKSLLFLAAGAWLTALGTKDLAALAGAGRRWPVVGLTFAAGALTLGGVPPLSIWVAKDELLAAALRRSPALYMVGLAAAAVSGLYAGKALGAVLRPEAPGGQAGYDSERPGTRRVTWAMQLPLPMLAAVAAGVGVLALPPAAAAFDRLLGVPDEPAPHPWQLLVSAVLAVAAVGLASWWTRQPARLPVPLPDAAQRWLAGWLGLEAVAQRLVVRPALTCSRALARFDDAVVDGGVHGVAAIGPGGGPGAGVVRRRGGRRGRASHGRPWPSCGPGGRHPAGVVGRRCRPGRRRRRPPAGQARPPPADRAAPPVLRPSRRRPGHPGGPVHPGEVSGAQCHDLPAPGGRAGPPWAASGP
jgi:NADH-quinone oxidoreductase subunit L